MSLGTDSDRDSRSPLGASAIRPLIIVVVALAGLFVPSHALASSPGDWTQSDVNAAIQQGADFMRTQQDLSGDPTSNPNYGAVGTTFPIPETAATVISFGVLDNGHFSHLSAAEQTSVRAAVNYLLRQQDYAGTGAWAAGGSLANYSTSLALIALSFAGDVPVDSDIGHSVADAKGKGRSYEIDNQQWDVGCETAANNDASHWYCGGWDYYALGRSEADMSNTGFAVTALDLSGGIPDQQKQRNLIWQRHTQELASNPGHSTNPGYDDNDGCGSYRPFNQNLGHYSNANDTGSNLFGFAYDGVPGSDSGVKASIACSQAFLDVYEQSKDIRTMAQHRAATLDAPCHQDDAGCNYKTEGDGGYHYSLFAISKGLGQYIPANISDPANFYAKIADLLLSQQDSSDTATKGSWSIDGRDDGSTVMSTGFSIFALGRVGQPASVSGVVFDDANHNGSRDSSEGGLGGWTVYVDANGNGSRDSGERSAVSKSDGSYTIVNIAPGTYPAVREVPQSGHGCTHPNGCAYKSVSLVSGQTATGFDFGNAKTTCPDTRPLTFTIHHRRHNPAIRARVYVDHKLVRDKKGHNLKKVKIKRPSQTKTTPVKIVLDFRNGTRITSRRTYGMCGKTVPKYKRTRHHHHRHHHH